MKIGNLFKIALKALNNNKMRCFLTMLGIIIGVASVITMLAIGQGSKDSIKKQISEMGSNMIMIFPGNMERGGVQQSSDDMQSMKPVDFENIRDEAKFVAAVSPMVSSQGQFICGANNYPSKVEGVNADYLEIRKLKVKDGMAFSDLDIKRASKVCVVGKTVVDKLFPDGGNPMGRVIRFNSIPLTIIGVLESKGYNSMGQDQDDIVLAPYTTVMKRILAIDYIQGIFASALTEAATDQATDEIEKILNRNHKIKSVDEEDYDIRSQQELSEMLNSTGDMMTLLLACVAGISLLVGGIGIMNIMLVSVTETYMMFMMPMPPTSSEMPATLPRRMVMVDMVEFIMLEISSCERMLKSSSSASVVSVASLSLWLRRRMSVIWFWAGSDASSVMAEQTMPPR